MSALAALCAHGVLGVVAVAEHAQPMPGDLAQLILSGHTIKAISEGDSFPDEFIPELLDLHRAGRFPFDKLITKFPFSEIAEAVEAHCRGECVKAVLFLPPTEEGQALTDASSPPNQRWESSEVKMVALPTPQVRRPA